MGPSRRDLERAAREAERTARDAASRLTSEPRRLAAAAAGTAAAAATGAGLRRFLSRDGAVVVDSDAYRLVPGEPVSAGIKRVVTGRVDHALAELRGETDSEPADAIHEARKDMKKIRSAVRLVRDPLGDDVYKHENEHYRDVGRMLSSFRDAEVRVETLDSLTERFESAGERFALLREQLEGELREARDGGTMEAAMAGAGVALERGRGRVESWPRRGDGGKLMDGGLRRSYRRGRKRLRAVEEEASVENLHEWRKRVKDLWYQLRLIREAEPALLGSLADHAHLLSDHLGDDHDLALLRELAKERPHAFGEAADQRLIFELIDLRRGELRFAAISLGQRIYSRKPKTFTKSLEARWRSR